MKRLGWFFLACLWSVSASLQTAAAERELASHQDLTASIDSGFGCARRGEITVRAPDRSAYTGDRIALQRLLAAARTGLGLDCPALREIGISGFAGGVPAFQDTITAARGWKLPADNRRIIAENPRLPAIAVKTSTCDHDRDQPFVGCWVVIDPPRWQGLILNIKRNGEWFSDRPTKLADGSTDKHGVSILRQPQIGSPDYLQMTDSQGYSISRAGPFFAEECTFMRIDPAAEPVDTWLNLATGSTVEPIFYVRLRSPLKINADILTGSIGPGGYTGDPGSAEIVEGLPDDAFNKCVDNFDEASTRLLDLAFSIIPLTRIERLFPYKFIGRYDIDRKIISYKEKVTRASQQDTTTFFSGTSYSPKVQWQMRQSDDPYHAFPESVTAFSKDGRLSTIVGNDGISRIKLEIPGTYGSKTGMFTFIKETDGSINHRLFVPN